jgi:4-aminobutyrate aminotransferase-like enzyme/Ser/Thr protein kinase RdoA (MazF antagonist)
VSRSRRVDEVRIATFTDAPFVLDERATEGIVAMDVGVRTGARLRPVGAGRGDSSSDLEEGIVTDTDLETPRPTFSPKEASRLARSLFAFEGNATEFGGERDQTFEIRHAAERRVLKISNRSETRTELDFELAILRHIEAVDPELPVPRQLPLADRAGAPGYVGLARKERTEHFVRMLTHLDGHVKVVGAGLSDASVRDFGQTAARLGSALRGLFHRSAGRTHLWDPGQIGGVRPLIKWIDDDDRRALVRRVIERFQGEALPRWPSLRAQVVHCDLNLENVLWDDEDRVCGVLDLGDAVHGPILLDVASALAAIMRRQEPGEVFRVGRLFLDGYSATTPLEPEEIELVGAVLSARLASMLVVGTWQMKCHPENAVRFESLIRDSWQILELLEEVGPEEVDRALGAPPPRQSAEVLREKRLRLLGPTLSKLFYDEPVHVVAGEGTWIIDVGGRRLLDAYNNVAVLGHCHPRVTEAVVDQTRRINTHTRYLYEPLMELAERLTDGVAEGHGLNTAMILNSGSEANDLAWRLATAYTGQQGGIVSDFAYHGMTTALSDLSPQQWPDGYHAPHIETFEVQNEDFGPSVSAARRVEGAIQRLAERGLKPAAMFIEGGFTTEGILTPSHADIVEAVRLAREAGALIVADEVQVGHGRTGSHLWSFERYGYTPDFITMGKPMGNGYPVAAMVTRSDIVARFRGGKYYFSTFGGNPVAARAALTVLEVIEDERLLGHVARVGESVRAMLSRLQSKNAAIADVRNHGTLFGVRIAATDATPAPRGAELVVNGLRRRGVLVGRTGRADDVVKIRPPLVFTEQDGVVLVNALEDTLGELAD